MLVDPRGLFASGHVAPVVNDKVLEAHGPGLQTAIDAVSRELTTSAMREMNGAVDLEARAAHGGCRVPARQRSDVVAPTGVQRRGVR